MFFMTSREKKIVTLLENPSFTKEDLVFLLNASREEAKLIFDKASEIKNKFIGNIVHFRGLIEFSNICRKNCYYCGIRKDNRQVTRYTIEDEEILKAAQFAHENHFGSLVLQSGELNHPAHIDRIDYLLKEIKKLTGGKLGITLSLGEQSIETYQRWHKSGGHRYLLRIETSNRELYYKLHPEDHLHGYETRLEALENLKKIGYQTGTGVMIGLPFQTLEDLAEDLLFMNNFDVDMVGMGPYIEHQQTPLYKDKDKLLPLEERFFLSLKMISILRIMMKDINIAAATALQSIDKMGREKAIKVGANIIMPNITPGSYRNDYNLYDNKPCTDEEADECTNCLTARISMIHHEIGFDEWGDSKHFSNRR